MITIDNYPNCDGEYDHRGEEWIAEYEVRINAETGKAEVIIF